VQLASGSTTSVFGNNTVTDAFDVASVTNVGVTTVVTAGSTTTVTIISTMPAGLTDGTYAVVALRAQALKVDGSTVEANGNSSVTSAFSTCLADVVLGDPIGTDDPNMALPDGYHSARSAYHVILTNLNVAKSSVVYSDPVNNTTNPKAIPGAIMEYLVVIRNTGGSSATAVTVTDNLTGTLAPNSINPWTSVTAGGIAGCATRARANINNGGWKCLDGVAGNGGLSSWTGQALTATVDTLVSGATATVVYQATIN
jgi:uncharacterized repeat protein (TIGR01451 family)